MSIIVSMTFDLVQEGKTVKEYEERMREIVCYAKENRQKPE
jgi:hypothetical protein